MLLGVPLLPARLPASVTPVDHMAWHTAKRSGIARDIAACIDASMARRLDNGAWDLTVPDPCHVEAGNMAMLAAAASDDFTDGPLCVKEHPADPLWTAAATNDARSTAVMVRKACGSRFDAAVCAAATHGCAGSLAVLLQEGPVHRWAPHAADGCAARAFRAACAGGHTECAMTLVTSPLVPRALPTHSCFGVPVVPAGVVLEVCSEYAAAVHGSAHTPVNGAIEAVMCYMQGRAADPAPMQAAFLCLP